MTTYTPDKWVIVEVKSPTHSPIYKVFACWGGSYLSGASWKMNSGIKHVIDKGEAFEAHGYSGSVYVLRNGGYGMTGYGAGVFQSMQDQISGLGEGYALTVFPEEQVDEFLKNFKNDE